MAINHQAESIDREAKWGAVIAAVLTAYSILANRRQKQAARTGSRGADDWHGRRASTPSEIPARGWWDIAMRVKDDISQNNLSLVAAGAAFYAFLAIPSVLTALVSLYGLMFNPGDVERQIVAMQGVLPDETIRLISDQLRNISSGSGSRLGTGFLISLLIALWSARSATASLIIALDITYGEQEKRSIIRFELTALGLTLAAAIFGVVALALIAVLPVIIDFLPLGSFGKTMAEIIRWPILLVLLMVMLAAMYRFAPSRKEPQWRWVSWGAVIATILWVIGSALFSIYVSRFAAYDKTYGSLGGVVVLLMWLYLTCFVVLLGAQINAEIEHQTVRDSTIDGQKPMGRRGARVADTVGPPR